MDAETPPDRSLSELEKRLLNEFQRDFPISPRPYAEIARRLDTDEETVLAALARLAECKYISRIGAVVTPHRAGWSTLAAMSVPPERLESVADLISARGEVNHNYEREHPYNLWFVVTGRDRDHVQEVLDEIESEAKLPALNLPMTESYRLDLGFSLKWN